MNCRFSASVRMKRRKLILLLEKVFFLINGPMLFINDNIRNFLKVKSWFLNILYISFGSFGGKKKIKWKKNNMNCINCVIFITWDSWNFKTFNRFSFFLQFLQHVCSLKTSLVGSSLTIIKIAETVQIVLWFIHWIRVRYSNELMLHNLSVEFHENPWDFIRKTFEFLEEKKVASSQGTARSM